MKSPRLTQLREAAKAAPLPAALSGVLLAALAGQALLPIEAELPAVAAMPPRMSGFPPVTVPTIGPHAEIAAREMFAPGQGKAEGGVVGGVTLLGIAASARGGAAVFRLADGSVTTVSPGERAGDWRLVQVGRSAVLLDGPGGTQRLALQQSAGTASSPAAARAGRNEEE